jgi:non-specific serine/threonine protein kinase
VLTERTRLEQRYLSSLRSLAEEHERRGDLPNAMNALHRVLAADPTDEAAHVRLIELLAGAGRHGDARKQYREMERLLREQLGTGPSPHALAVVKNLPRHNVAPSASSGSTASTVPPAPSDSGSPAGEAGAATALALAPVEVRLPLRLDRFVGREGELDELCAAIAPAAGGPRLITLTGVGGTGKTRLALQVMDLLAEEYPGAAWFVPLADVHDGPRIADAVLNAMRQKRHGEIPDLDQVVSGLAGRPVLLCLDNMEHLVEESAAVVQTLLARLPELRVLATSRQRLDIGGEHEMSLAPMPTPDLAGTPDRLREFASVQLFEERARAALSTFRVSPENASVVASICRQLEGLPLAIELAAAAVSVLTPAQLEKRLRTGLAVPEATRRDIPERHRTMRAAITSSYRLLEPPLQRFFRSLAVFRGGWTLEAAETICGEPRAFEYLRALRDRSLVVCEHAGEEMRYRLLESLREFAAEQSSPEEKARLSAEHLKAQLELAREADDHLDGPNKALWLDRLARELDNFREALRNAENDPPEGSVPPRLALCASLWRFWWMRGLWHEGLAQLEKALACVRSADPAHMDRRASALSGAGMLSSMMTDYARAAGYLEQALELRRGLHDPKGIADALHDLGSALLHQDVTFSRGKTMIEEALEIRRRIDDLAGIAQSLNSLGNTEYDQRDFARAEDLYRQSLRLRQQIGDTRGAAASLNNLGVLAERAGDYAAARACYEESLAGWRELGDQWGISLGLGNLGLLALHEKAYDRARALFVEALRLRWSIGDRRLLVGSLQDMCRLAAAEGHAWRGAVITGCARAGRDALGIVVRPFELDIVNGIDEGLQRALGEEAFAEAVAQGRSMTLEQGCEYVLRDEPHSMGGAPLTASIR